jgi:hypothetical protein
MSEKLTGFLGKKSTGKFGLTYTFSIAAAVESFSTFLKWETVDTIAANHY